mmetsp:Transcript_4254/g.15086  ORF Transcript_4254/g.15086 Transcript_4254/m.15086 type:complete len:104 (+) Transcript_4254:210-521(+)
MLDQGRHRREPTDRSDARHPISQEALSTLSEKSIEEAIERLERENPTHWMTDRNVFEKVKQDVEEKIMRAVDVEVWTTLEAPEQREEILRQVEEALGSILLRR